MPAQVLQSTNKYTHTKKYIEQKKKRTSNISFHFSGIAQEKKKTVQYQSSRINKKKILLNIDE